MSSHSTTRKKIHSPTTTSIRFPSTRIALLTTVSALALSILEGTTVSFAHATTTTTTTTTSGNKPVNKPWLQEHFPNPTAALTTCYPTSTTGDEDSESRSHRICDPDQVLSAEGIRKVDAFLKTNPKYINVVVESSDTNDIGDCKVYGSSTSSENDNDNNNDRKTEEEGGRSTTTTTTNEELLELQMAVALVKKMNLTPFVDGKNDNSIEDRAAETFGRYIHDQWGVGIETTHCGGAGILLFLSIMDRTVYISRGAALANTLTDRRLDRIIENMKDDLRAGDYHVAILGALHDIHSYVDQGPPNPFWEHTLPSLMNMLIPFLWICMVLAPMIRNWYMNSRFQRQYAHVRSQLNELDRAKAQALQGKYNCTSCPICLEDFAPPEEGSELVTHGSDGLPIKLLRCGHCMDETCWAEWINSGRGTITKCPICMQDVGEDIVEPTNNNNAQQQQQGDGDHNERQQLVANNNNNNNNNLANWNDNNHQEDEQQEEEENRIMRQYRRERNFRLARLGDRYPRFVRPAQIQRWSNPTYDGQLVRDPGFVQSNPSLATPAPRGGGGSRIGGGGGGGFGGSSSGGGRGGRW